MEVLSSLFSSQPSADIKITFDGEEKRKLIEGIPLYFDGEAVRGKVQIRARDGKRIEHNGIRVEFVGQIAAAGELKHSVSFDFEFKNVEKAYESYAGDNVCLKYFTRVSILRRIQDIAFSRQLHVYSYNIPPELNESIKMEVGIEDCLHIEFEYSKSKYNMKDLIVGKIYFLLVRVKIKHMELSIIRRETIGTNTNSTNTLHKHEIMDGAPLKGATIPIRLFLGCIPSLTPTFRDVNKKFSVRYFLNLVLVDEEGRRYFKQQEVTLWRGREKDEKEIK